MNPDVEVRRAPASGPCRPVSGIRRVSHDVFPDELDDQQLGRTHAAEAAEWRRPVFRIAGTGHHDLRGMLREISEIRDAAAGGVLVDCDDAAAERWPRA